MRPFTCTAFALLAFLAATVPGRAADPILPPFDPDATRLAIGRQIAFGPCPEPPAPIVDMSGLQSRYDPKDPTQSKVDPERDRRDKERSVAPTKLVTDVDKLADRFAISLPANMQMAACVGHKIAVWARANALTQNVDQNDRLGRHQAIMSQAWYGSGLSSALVKIGGFAAMPREDADAIKPWLQRMAATVKAEYTPPFSWMIPSNNHKYWAGYFLAVTAALYNDAEFYKFSRKILDDAFEDIGADGMIAKEMARGPRSLGYQQFAILPIVAMTVQAERNGVAPSAKQYQTLDRMMAFTAEAAQNPQAIEARLQVKQEPANRSFDFSWIDMILPSLKKRNPDLAAKLEPIVTAPRMRPAWHIFLGGDVTAAYNPTVLARSPQ